MPRINVLDDKTINKIAAGEVIERPASIIKELVENSIDAESSTITIEIENGGKSMIKIVDDGCGINADDINKAFMRHATSKILKAEDLYELYSLGFRGEALASISAVSKVDMITKTKDALLATKVRIEGGNKLLKEPIAANQGTQIIVEDLFFNIPARRKFLKSDHSESMAITGLVNKLAIGNPSIRFKYINNKKMVFETLGDGNLLNLIGMIYGRDVAQNLIRLDYDGEYFRIEGYIANNNIYRSNRNMQHIFINSRYVKSSNILNIINDSYKAIIPINKYPVCFLNIYIDPSAIDVNIHPNKLEVKFDRENEVLDDIQDYIRGILLKNSLIGKYSLSNSKTSLYTDENRIGSFDSFTYNNGNMESTDKVISSQSVSKEKQNALPGEKQTIKENIDIDDVKSNTFISLKDISSTNSLNKELLYKIDRLEKIAVEEDGEQYIAPTQMKFKNPEEIAKNMDFVNLRYTGVVFDTYVIFTKGDDMIMLDQHAAHERIRFEMYMQKFRKQELSIQMLIDPIILELSYEDMEIVTKNIDVFKQFGFILEEFGHKNISVRGVPNTFGTPESQRFIYEIIDKLGKIDSIYDTKYDDIAEIACKSAIKANDKISMMEAVELLNQLKNCDNPYTCPHGRPVMVKMTKYDIEKLFKRKI